MEIYKVSIEEIGEYIEAWTERKEDDRNLLYAENKEKHYFVAVDNLTGNCWVEEFKTEKKALKWLTEGLKEVKMKEYYIGDYKIIKLNKINKKYYNANYIVTINHDIVGFANTLAEANKMCKGVI